MNRGNRCRGVLHRLTTLPVFSFCSAFLHARQLKCRNSTDKRKHVAHQAIALLLLELQPVFILCDELFDLVRHREQLLPLLLVECHWKPA